MSLTGPFALSVTCTAGTDVSRSVSRISGCLSSTHGALTGSFCDRHPLVVPSFSGLKCEKHTIDSRVLRLISDAHNVGCVSVALRGPLSNMRTLPGCLKALQVSPGTVIVRRKTHVTTYQRLCIGNSSTGRSLLAIRSVMQLEQIELTRGQSLSAHSDANYCIALARIY